MRKILLIKILVLLLTLTHQGTYQQYYEQAYRIVNGMSIDQKIGQCLQVDFNAFITKHSTDEALAAKLHLGSLLVSGDGTPDENGNMVTIPDSDETSTIKIYAQSTMEKWQKLSAKFNFVQNITANDGQKYNIYPLLGTDAVHGNQHVSGSVLFPHNSGMACSHNAENFYNAGYWTGQSVKKSGFNYAFSPTVAVSHNPQWGRFYETMGQQEDFIYDYAKKFTEGLQGSSSNPQGIIGSVKHFYGDGATLWGADEGNAVVGSYKSFINHNTQGYKGSISAGVGSVMVSYSAINYLPLAIGPAVNTILRQKLNFDGFVISDYDEVEGIKANQLPTSFVTVNSTWQTVSLMMNAGIDMIMIPGWRGSGAVTDVINGIKTAINNKTLSVQRVNDAAARILSVKLAMGAAKKATSLSEEPQEEEQKEKPKHISTQYWDSLKAVQESLVLLKNENVLPVNKDQLKYVVLVGQRTININHLAKNELFLNYDNIGMQNGGWTLRWQGFEGNTMWEGTNKELSNASSIKDALLKIGGNLQLLQPNYTTYTETTKINTERNQYLEHLKTVRKQMTPQNTLILSVLGETTFAEFKGDIGVPYCVNQSVLGGEGCLYSNAVANPYLPKAERESLSLEFEKFDKEVIEHVRAENKDIPMLTVILSGRPMIITDILKDSNAVLDAFLPGTSGGQGIVNAIVGDYKLRPNGTSDKRNTLAFDWPKTQDQLKDFPVYKADGEIPKISDPLYEVGHGLSTATSQQDQ